MGIYLDGQEYDGMHVAGQEIAKAQAGGAEYHSAAATPTHTFTITVGQSGGSAGASRGYNAPAGFGSIQTGSSAQYDTPGGKSVTVIHCRRVNGNLNFALSGAADVAADFPTRIVATKTTGGEVQRSFTPTGNRRSVAGGVRQDYAPESGSPTDVFINNQTVRIDLYY